jgi:hypothetical protein
MIIRSSKSEASPEHTPFLYDGFVKGKEPEESLVATIGVNSPLRLEVDIRNPFKVPVTVVLQLANVPNCLATGSPIELRPAGVARAGLWIRALAAGEISIDTLDLVISQGVQKLRLPNSLKIIAYENAVAFSVRTDLPVSQALTVIRGECLHFGLFLTNTG